jgi:hypothetical protein
MCANSVICQKLSKVNCRPKDENSPNLVTLILIFFYSGRKKIVAVSGFFSDWFKKGFRCSGIFFFFPSLT